MTDQSFFAARRADFMDRLSGEIAVVPAAKETIRNHDVHHSFRQDSDFWYLTGFEEPDAIAVLDPSHPDESYVLFVRPKDRETEIWAGRRAGVAGAVDLYGADAAYPLEDFDKTIRERLLGRRTVHVPMRHRKFAQRVSDLMIGLRRVANRYGRPVPDQLHDATPLLDEMRLHKTADEIDLLRRAGEISARGHAEAMRIARPGLYEYQVAAAMEYVWRMNGSRRDGYPSIVAGGENACILHYTENASQLHDGDLLLIDAAAEYGYFSADITRTFPVNGQFSPQQRAIYELVLAAQHASFAASVQGSTMRAVHESSVAQITEGLVDIGLLPGPVDRARSMNHYREFFMHGTGHWLGHDVHDAGNYGVDGKPRHLQVGMSFTVEPGIYVSAGNPKLRLSLLEYDPDIWTERRLMMGAAAAKKLEAEERDAAGYEEFEVPAEFLGIGIRIEDDVLITEDGLENLTGSLPTDPDEIEALCTEPPTLPTLT
jgi:Xaa-Pro aminopeptidase